MRSFWSSRRRLGRGCAALLLAVGAFVVSGGPVAPAGAVDAPDGSRSTITQQLVHREPLAGGGWRITIEATLDSNTVCHVFLLQCVVEPQLVTPHMKLQSIECVSPNWANIQITLPFVNTVVNVCARFDAERAGRDQRFRFVYVTDFDVGTVNETVRFFRFPEEFFFTRAENTITIDLAAEADISEQCPDTAAIGTQVDCTVRVEALSNVPTASVNRTVPAQFANATLTPDADPGNWDCTALTACDYTANGGTLQPGVYTFTASADVVAPPDDVQDCADVATVGTSLGSACADVSVYEADIDTTLDIEKTSTAADVTPGAPISYTITVTNLGPNPATTLAVFENPPALLTGATLAFAGGDGTWACVNGTTLICTAPTLANGGVATFTVTGTVALTAQDGDVIVNEIAAGWANDPFGPDVTVRDGNAVRVVSNAVVPVTPRFTG
jgi:uncharacterized repeat protein (TIGR01451 family)